MRENNKKIFYNHASDFKSLKNSFAFWKENDKPNRLDYLSRG